MPSWPSPTKDGDDSEFDRELVDSVSQPYGSRAATIHEAGRVSFDTTTIDVSAL
jgi:hypothetical protein